MAEERAVSSTTVGGKAATLSAATIYSVAVGRTRVPVDASALDRLAPNEAAANPTSRIHLIPSIGRLTLTNVETRAALAVLLQKILSSSDLRPAVPCRIADILRKCRGLRGFFPCL